MVFLRHALVALTVGTADAGAAASFRPLWEPTLQEYFEPLRDFVATPPKQPRPTAQVVRRRDISKKEFNELVRKGQPFVVDDCAEGWPFTKWTCKDFSKAWPSGNMKSEYSPGQARQSLGDEKWYTKNRPAMAHKEHLSGGKKIAGPYIWHVKDEEPLATKQDVQKHWQTPYFLNTTAANRYEAWDSFEFWFSMPDGGAFAHSDSYNEMTISAQLRGRKTWRLGMYPESQTVFDSFDSFDTGIYKVDKWVPEYEFEVSAGQCFVFPPGYIHETYVKPEQNPECTVATTFQYNVPFPAKYIRSFLPRFMNSHLVWQEGALNLWSPYLQVIHSNTLQPVTEAAQIDGRVKEVLDTVDKNGDQSLSLPELEDFYLNNPKGRFSKNRGFSWFKFVSKAQRQEVAADLAESRAGDVVAWHDLDEDGAISRSELVETMTNWNLLLARYKSLKGLKKTMKKKSSNEKAKNIEVDFLETHGGCKGENATEAKNCLEALEALRKREVAPLFRLSAFQDSEDGDRDEL